MRYLDINLSDLRDAESRPSGPRQVLGRLAAMSVSGNDVSGSVFYAFPLVVSAAGKVSAYHYPSVRRFGDRNIFTELLAHGCIAPVFFRPVLLQLASH